jgi:hypothetical protein
VNNKVKPNRYKPESMETGYYAETSIISIDVCIKCIMTIVFITILSLACIFGHDFVTQSTLFNIKKIKISGATPAFEKEILKLADLNYDKNIFQINLYHAEKLIASHPWIESAIVKRNMMTFELIIKIIKEKPMAIVKIGNVADILLNTRGKPFKEYNPQKDKRDDLPFISGINLKKSGDQYLFISPLFKSVMEFLNTDGSNHAKFIRADHNTGITVLTKDIYNKTPLSQEKTIQLKFGFNNYKAKFNKAIKIGEYINHNYPERTISTMDLFNINKVFIKTEPDRSLQNG